MRLASLTALFKIVTDIQHISILGRTPVRVFKTIGRVPTHINTRTLDVTAPNVHSFLQLQNLN